MLRGTALIMEGICVHCEGGLVPAEEQGGRCPCCQLWMRASPVTGNYMTSGIPDLGCKHIFDADFWAQRAAW